MLNEPLCNGANGIEILQNFQNDTATTLIINNMNENESIKIEIVKFGRKHFVTLTSCTTFWQYCLTHNRIDHFYSNDPCYCWGNHNFRRKTDGFCRDFLRDIKKKKKKVLWMFFYPIELFFVFYTPSWIESRRLFA